ncbi:TetR family transcriptional regulator [Mycobacteroides abscessus subsp. abscessus]|nr:TetR family transcriptional regulator [Mycobacteroides abscessus subsp. abscessus]
MVAAVLGRTEAPEAAAVAADAFESWRKILIDRLARYDVDGETARSLASTMIAAIEGAVIMSIAAQSTEALDDVGQRLVELVRLYVPAGAKPNPHVD